MWWSDFHKPLAMHCMCCEVKVGVAFETRLIIWVTTATMCHSRGPSFIPLRIQRDKLLSCYWLLRDGMSSWILLLLSDINGPRERFTSSRDAGLKDSAYSREVLIVPALFEPNASGARCGAGSSSAFWLLIFSNASFVTVAEHFYHEASVFLCRDFVHLRW